VATQVVDTTDQFQPIADWCAHPGPHLRLVRVAGAHLIETIGGVEYPFEGTLGYLQPAGRSPFFQAHFHGTLRSLLLPSQRVVVALGPTGQGMEADLFWSGRKADGVESYPVDSVDEDSGLFRVHLADGVDLFLWRALAYGGPPE
jgi:hypothetical protein